jgi:membrane fusion protein (multidrug efflux system)
MLVPSETCVVANFKESQIGHMQAGDAVDIEVDAFPGSGVIDTLSPATGARFSLIAPTTRPETSPKSSSAFPWRSSGNSHLHVVCDRALGR